MPSRSRSSEAERGSRVAWRGALARGKEKLGFDLMLEQMTYQRSLLILLQKLYQITLRNMTLMQQMI